VDLPPVFFFFGHHSPIFGLEFLCWLEVCAGKKIKMPASFISHLIIEHSWTFSSVSCRYCILLAFPLFLEAFLQAFSKRAKLSQLVSCLSPKSVKIFLLATVLPFLILFSIFCNFFLLSILFSLALNQRMCASWLRARGWETRGKDI